MLSVHQNCNPNVLQQVVMSKTDKTSKMKLIIAGYSLFFFSFLLLFCWPTNEDVLLHFGSCCFFFPRFIHISQKVIAFMKLFNRKR